jgi:hypothetical protein
MVQYNDGIIPIGDELQNARFVANDNWPVYGAAAKAVGVKPHMNTRVTFYPLWGMSL